MIVLGSLESAYWTSYYRYVNHAAQKNMTSPITLCRNEEELLTSDMISII